MINQTEASLKMVQIDRLTTGRLQAISKKAYAVSILINPHYSHGFTIAEYLQKSPLSQDAIGKIDEAAMFFELVIQLSPYLDEKFYGHDLAEIIEKAYMSTLGVFPPQK